MVMEGLQEDMGDGNMQCTDHPYKNNTTGGICAFCLQEKLGKLVSSSFSVAVFPSYSSSSSPSFSRSEFGPTACTLSVPQKASLNGSSNNDAHGEEYHSSRLRMASLLTQKKKNNDLALAGAPGQRSVVLKRSKSTATPRRRVNFTEADDCDEFSPRKRGFWSFLHLSKQTSAARKINKPCKEICYSNPSTVRAFARRSRENKNRVDEFVLVEENESPKEAEFERKVSRSRSVGCGSRSFSGDFFERISTGLGDCTLRRVESQREGKPKVNPIRGGGGGHDCIKERVKCGGIFSGFMITSSSSSSASSYWVSSSAEDNNMNGKPAAAIPAGHLAHGRSKSWGWALASPMRAFSKPSSSSSGKRDAPGKNTTPNLNAIPSLLAARG